MSSFSQVITGFVEGWRSGGRTSLKKCIHEDKELREHLSESQIDKMVRDSFPASDPPSNY